MYKPANIASGVGFESSVRVPTENNNKQKNELDSNKIQNRGNIYNRSNLLEDNQMRDLYNRKKKLEYWMAKRYSVLDRDDILTITRCISIIIQIRKQIDKPLSEVGKDDIKAINRFGSLLTKN